MDERVVVGICNDNGKFGDAAVDEGDSLSFDRRCEPNDVGFFKDVGVGPNETFDCGSFRARSVVVFESASCT